MSNKKNTNHCEKKEILERMNYLYQASKYLSKYDNITASCFGNAMISCSRKAVLRIDTDVKRTICKCCQTPLIPGETSRVRLITKPIKAIRSTCLICHTSKRIPTKPGYKLWTEDPNSVNQIFHYTPKIKDNNSKINSNIKTESNPSSGVTSTPDEKIETDKLNESVNVNKINVKLSEGLVINK
ncbi:ribonuclease P protein subunit p21 [Microplitis mediator]|uniref:ribonuclease P protein subunit p21 n=1 Tax=Microplitis mediator TaxID=375433 RepID=UPI002552BEF0|nr:ribonuclease P protein subunit p21 [Microplitis mediator]